VLSTGDTTGYGQHGDYVFGWKGDSLQRAMDAGCTGASCTGIKTQTVEEANKCAVPGRVREDFDGCKFSSPISVVFYVRVAVADEDVVATCQGWITCRV
jgi:hypothetical protein